MNKSPYARRSTVHTSADHTPWDHLLQGVQGFLTWINRQQQHPGAGKFLLTGLMVFALALLWLWDWRLGSAVMVGSMAMVGIYLWQTPHAGQRWTNLKRVFTGSNLPFVLSVSGGATATFGSYTAVSIWAESSQRWLATGMILQGMVTLTILGLLLWEWVQRQQERSVNQFEHCLAEITSADAFKRLVGVRRLQTLLQREHTTSDQARLATDYLRLALEQETVPIVREALLEALRGWGVLRRLDAQGNPTPSVTVDPVTSPTTPRPH